mmetsp:Transcript_32282/g.113611  ORF Transcript_32282/g.113611 Transcript_32282/m.113611 type:complete len:219 (-) Transcript_32282:84-740(-)
MPRPSRPEELEQRPSDAASAGIFYSVRAASTVPSTGSAMVPPPFEGAPAGFDWSTLTRARGSSVARSAAYVVGPSNALRQWCPVAAVGSFRALSGTSVYSRPLEYSRPLAIASCSAGATSLGPSLPLQSPASRGGILAVKCSGDQSCRGRRDAHDQLERCAGLAGSRRSDHLRNNRVAGAKDAGATKEAVGEKSPLQRRCKKWLHWSEPADAPGHLEG